MPNKHFYFALGATCGAALAIWVYRRRHFWYRQHGYSSGLYNCYSRWPLLFPLPMALLGCMALVPDALYATGVLPKESVRMPLFNVFFGYAWFELIEDSSAHLDRVLNAIGSLLIFGQCLGVLIVYLSVAKKLLFAPRRVSMDYKPQKNLNVS